MTSPRWRELYLLAGLRGVSFAGDIAAATAITLYFQSHGYAAGFLVAALVASTAPAVLLAPVTGRLADCVDSRKILVFTAAAQAAVCVVLAAVLNAYAVIGLTAVLSAGLALTHPVFGGLPRSIVGADNVTRAATISQTSAMAGMLAAPALGAFLAGAFGTRAALLFDAASFVLVASGALLITTRLHERSTSTTAAAAPDTSFSVWRDPFLRALLGATGLVVTCVSINNVASVYLVRDVLGASKPLFGVMGSAWMVGLVVGSVVVAKNKKLSALSQMVMAFGCMGAALLLCSVVPSVWWLVPIDIIGGIGNGTMATNLHVLLNLQVPDSHRGRAFAALGAVSNAAPMVGYLAGGFLEVAGPRTSYAVIGTAACLGTLAVTPALLRRRKSEPRVRNDALVTAG